MRTSRIITATAVLAIALTGPLAGCGGPSEAEKDRAAARAKAEASKAAEIQAAAEQQATYDACVEQIQPLMDALTEIDGRLDVGIKNADYGNRVGDVSVAYNKLDADTISAISEECLDAGARLERAYNQYVAAMNTWDACLSDYYCDFSDGSAKSNEVQKNWSNASTAIANAQNVLNSMAPAEQ